MVVGTMGLLHDGAMLPSFKMSCSLIKAKLFEGENTMCMYDKILMDVFNRRGACVDDDVHERGRRAKESY